MGKLRRQRLRCASAAGLACALPAPACQKKELTGVQVTPVAGAHTPAGIKKIDFTVTLAGRTATASLSDPSGADITFPTDGFLQINSGTGAVTISASARNAADAEVDSGTGSGTVVSE